MKLRNILTGIAAAAILLSCQKDYEPEKLPTFELAGEWFVQTYYGGTADSNVVLGYVHLVTSNTAAANGGEILIDDKGNIWPFKVKCPANSEARTFGGSDLLNISDSSVTVTITNGVVIPDARITASGVVVDSIYMEAVFSDDPGNQYIFAGHYRTGFLEDEL